MKYHLLWPRLSAAVRPAPRGTLARFGGWLSTPAFSRATIAARITVVMLTLAVPINLVIVAIFWQLSETASEVQRTGLIYMARTMAAALDAKLGEYLTVGQALARSPALFARDLDAFEAEARRTFASERDAWVVVADPEGQPLIDTARVASQQLPVRDPVGLAAQKRALETHSVVISGLWLGTAAEDWVVSIEVPIFKEGRPFRALAVAVRAQSFLRLLNDRHLPKNWVAGIIDGQGRYIARVPGNQGHTGQPAPLGSRKVNNEDSVFEMLSVDGGPVASANAHSAASEWAVAVSIQKPFLQTAVWGTIRWGMILTGCLAILSLLLARATARGITGPIAELRRTAGALLTGSPPLMPPPGPPEVRDLWQALKQAVADRDRSEQALRESEERLRLSNEAGGIGTFTVDPAAGCVYYSPELAVMLGFPGVRTTTIEAAFTRVHRDDASQARTLFEAGLSGAGAGLIKAEFRFVRPGGEVRWMTWAGRVYFSEGPGGPIPLRIDGACVDITERKRQEEHIRFLLREVNHRSKNLLTLVQAVARQTLAANPQDFLDRFGQRVEALAASQDLLIKNAWRGADLSELIRSQLAHFDDLIGTRITLQGPPLSVSASAAQALGMALHELATNAGKYGALSSADGRIEITWRLQRDESDTETFVIAWREHCANPIAAPCQQGFGSSVIGSMAEMSLGAQVELDYPATGLTWRLQCAAEEALEGRIAPSQS